MSTVGPTKVLPLGKMLLGTALAAVCWLPVVLGFMAVTGSK